MQKTNLTGRLFRFTLSFDGEPQDVGLLSGIYDTGLPETQIHKLSEHLDKDLPIVNLGNRPIHGCYPEFWFTEKGLLAFRDDLWRIKKALPSGWDVEAAMLHLDQFIGRVINQPDVSSSDPEIILYSDEYQIALADIIRKRLYPVTFTEKKCRSYLRDKRFLTMHQTKSPD